MKNTASSIPDGFQTTTESSQLRTISRLLHLFEQPKTSARGRAELSPEEKEIIQKLADNQITKEEKKAVILLLSNNEVAMEHLASLAKPDS